MGITKDRFCIKIPSTGPALSVCSTLEAEGIRTLGTAVFSLPQAIAASQARCLYISPYFNGMSLEIAWKLNGSGNMLMDEENRNKGQLQSIPLAERRGPRDAAYHVRTPDADARDV